MLRKNTEFLDLRLIIGVKKLATFNQKSIGMSKDQEIKKLKEKIEELEFVKDFQQDLILDFEEIVGKELSKKHLPKDLIKET